MGVEAGEKYCRGEIAWEEARKADWHSEASAFLFDYNDETHPEIASFVAQLTEKRDEAERLLIPASWSNEESARELLRDAAYFANFALCYPTLRFGKHSKRQMEGYGRFMPLELFQAMVPGQGD